MSATTRPFRSTVTFGGQSARLLRFIANLDTCLSFTEEWFHCRTVSERRIAGNYARNGALQASLAREKPEPASENYKRHHALVLQRNKSNRFRMARQGERSMKTPSRLPEVFGVAAALAVVVGALLLAN
jgi:hypothetical protein